MLISVEGQGDGNTLLGGCHSLGMQVTASQTPSPSGGLGPFHPIFFLQLPGPPAGSARRPSHRALERDRQRLSPDRPDPGRRRVAPGRQHLRPRVVQVVLDPGPGPVSPPISPNPGNVTLDRDLIELYDFYRQSPSDVTGLAARFSQFQFRGGAVLVSVEGQGDGNTLLGTLHGLGMQVTTSDTWSWNPIFGIGPEITAPGLERDRQRLSPDRPDPGRRRVAPGRQHLRRPSCSGHTLRPRAGAGRPSDRSAESAAADRRQSASRPSTRRALPVPVVPLPTTPIAGPTPAPAPVVGNPPVSSPVASPTSPVVPPAPNPPPVPASPPNPGTIAAGTTGEVVSASHAGTPSGLTTPSLPVATVTPATSTLVASPHSPFRHRAWSRRAGLHGRARSRTPRSTIGPAHPVADCRPATTSRAICRSSSAGTRPTTPSWVTNRLIVLLKLPGFANFATARMLVEAPWVLPHSRYCWRIPADGRSAGIWSS